jgi:hypothetical protein
MIKKIKKVPGKIIEAITRPFKQMLCDHTYKVRGIGGAFPEDYLLCVKCKKVVSDYEKVSNFINSCDHNWENPKDISIETCSKCGNARWTTPKWKKEYYQRLMNERGENNEKP